MSTRLYLINDLPSVDPGTTHNATTLPVGSFKDSGIAVKSLRTTKGSGDFQATYGSQAITTHADEFFTSFSTEALAAQTITAEEWSFGILPTESSNQANSFLAFCLYTWDGAVVDYLYDDDTPLANEWGTGYSGRVGVFNGAASTISEGDILVLEVWRHTDGQNMSMAYTQGISISGSGADVTAGSGITTAPFIDTPYTLLFPGGAVGEPGHKAADYLRRARSISRR